MFRMSDRVYDIVKWAVGVILPAIAVLYGAWAPIFGFPMPEKVAGTVMALVMFLGAFLQLSSQAWALERVKLTGKIFRDDNNDGIPDYPFKMSGKVYETLKWFAQVALPAIGVAYTAMAPLWGLPYAEEAPLFTGALVIFLNTVLQFNSAMYRKAVINSWQEPVS